jgi:hypothetical protein
MMVVVARRKEEKRRAFYKCARSVEGKGRKASRSGQKWPENELNRPCGRAKNAFQ